MYPNICRLQFSFTWIGDKSFQTIRVLCKMVLYSTLYRRLSPALPWYAAFVVAPFFLFAGDYFNVHYRKFPLHITNFSCLSFCKRKMVPNCGEKPKRVSINIWETAVPMLCFHLFYSFWFFENLPHESLSSRPKKWGEGTRIFPFVNRLWFCPSSF